MSCISLVMPEQIIGTKTILSRTQYADMPRLLSTVKQNEQRLEKAFWWTKDYKDSNTLTDYVAYVRAMWDRSEVFEYVIYDMTTMDVAGQIIVHSVDWNNKHGELGFWVAEKYEGKKYIQEAVTLIEASLFARNMNRIEIRCDINNIRCRSVAEKMQYKCEGTLRENLCSNKTFRSTVLFSKLKQDFFATDSKEQLQG